MENKTIRKFQSILAAANIPTNQATAEAILIFATFVLDGDDSSIDSIMEVVDSVNDRIARETQAKEILSKGKPLQKVK